MDTPPRKRMTREERRLAILEATRLEIRDHGFKSVTTRSIAARAGVNEALLFNHFKSKKDLLEAAAREMMGRHDIPLIPVSEISEDDFFRQLGLFETYFLGLNAEDPGRLKIMMYGILEGMALPDEMNPLLAQGLATWFVGCLEKGKREWGFHRDLDPMAVLPMYFGALFHYIILHHLVLKRPEPIPGSMGLVPHFRRTVKGEPP